MSYGMFSEKGNQRIQKLVDYVVDRGKDDNYIKNTLSRLSHSKSYPEASDTAVREAIYGEILKRRTVLVEGRAQEFKTAVEIARDLEIEQYNEQMFERKAADLDQMTFTEWRNHKARMARWFKEQDNG